MRTRTLAGSIIFLILLLIPAFVPPVFGDTPQDITITYLITLHKDSSATWDVEYRIPLQSPADTGSFEENTNNSPILSSENLRQLMEQSVFEAAGSTGRPMTIDNFSRSDGVRSWPTGTYGFIRYTFLWTNFTPAGDTIRMGDAFPGGLYLPIGASFIVQIPDGYSVASVEPAPGAVNSNIVWYGPDPFGAGEPMVTLVPAGISPVTLALAGICGILVLAAGAFLFRRRRIEKPGPVEIKSPEPATGSSSETEIRQVEERILRVLDEAGGELFQSEIVRRLSLPKSTVSTALNDLHVRRLIQKVKKGRENLIRRIPPG